jgi:hypothetical protein
MDEWGFLDSRRYLSHDRDTKFTNWLGIQVLFSLFTCMPNTQYTYLLLEYLVAKDVSA